MSADLDLVPRGLGRFDTWRRLVGEIAGLGPVSVEIRTEIDAQPSAASLAAVNDLERLADAQSQDVRTLVLNAYEHARRLGACEFWGVPNDMSADQVMCALGGLILSIAIDGSAAIEAEHCPWDREHGLSIVLKNGVFEHE